MVSSVSREMFSWWTTFWTSMMGEAPETVTVSSTAPTPIVTSTLAVNPVVSSIPSRMKVLKPGSVNVIV